MKSVFLAFLKISFNILSEYMNWKNKIQTISSNLEDQKEKLKDLNGYDEIFKAVKTYLKIMPFYEKIYYAIIEIRNQVGIS